MMKLDISMKKQLQSIRRGKVCQNNERINKNKQTTTKTRMMWPSQNLLLHNGTIRYMIKKEKLITLI